MVALINHLLTYLQLYWRDAKPHAKLDQRREKQTKLITNEQFLTVMQQTDKTD